MSKSDAQHAVSDVLVLERDILLLLSQGLGEDEALSAVLQKIRNFFAIEAVGIRREDNEDYPYSEMFGFHSDFVSTESRLCSFDEQGSYRRDKQGKSCLACFCGAVIRNQIDRSLPCVTPFGSFWTNSTTKLLESYRDDFSLYSVRNICHLVGYETVVLIPLRMNGVCYGLLQCNDRREDVITPIILAQLENIAITLAVFLRQTLRHKGLEESLDKIARKQAESEVKQAKKHLEHAGKMRILGQLAGSMAHDFNNRLGTMVGYAYMLLNHPDEEVRSIATSLHDCAKGASVLPKQLLSFSSKNISRKEECSVHQSIEQALSMLRYRMHATIHTALKLDAERDLILGNMVQLQDIWINLWMNASHAMPDGGVVTITTATEEFGGIVFLIVRFSDTGVGMTKEVQDQVFEPFFTTRQEGSGMGLATVQGTIQSYGGSIDVESSVDYGAQFTLRLPIKESRMECDEEDRVPQKEERPNETPIDMVQPTLGRGHVLVIDDDDQVRRMVKELLVRFGYHATSCSSGERALEFYRYFSQSVDLILLDMIMPEMSGMDVFYRLREINPEARILILTGYSKDEDVEKLCEDGAEGIVGKPFNPDHLSKTVWSAIKMGQ